MKDPNFKTKNELLAGFNPPIGQSTIGVRRYIVWLKKFDMFNVPLMLLFRSRLVWRDGGEL